MVFSGRDDFGAAAVSSPGADGTGTRLSTAGGFFVTAGWGFLAFLAMLIGQSSVILYALMQNNFDLATLKDSITGVIMTLSVILSLPPVLLVAWGAARSARRSFADYLALRWTSWSNVALAVAGLVVLELGWGLMSSYLGREPAPGIDVFKMAYKDGVLVLFFLAACVAAPVWEEVFARGILYGGWSQSFLRVPGAIVASSLVWTLPHLQYGWYNLGEVFCMGLWFGYMRYRSNSTSLTIVVHGLNNLAAAFQAYYVLTHS